MRIVRYHNPRSLVQRGVFSTPWAGFEDQINRAMDAAFPGFFTEPAPFSGDYQPRVDLFEDKDNYHFRVELPGMKREDIHVELRDGVLTLSGTRTGYGSDGKLEQKSEFTRSISVPNRVQEDKIAARYEDGVLAVALPKAEEAKPRKIAVQVK